MCKRNVICPVSNYFFVFGFLVISCFVLSGCCSSGCCSYEEQRISELKQKIEDCPKAACKVCQEQKFCQALYEVYRQCYGAGIRCGGNNICCAVAGTNFYMDLLNEFKGIYDSANIKERLALTCTAACKSAGTNKGLPSYEEIERDVCNKAFNK